MGKGKRVIPSPWKVTLLCLHLNFRSSWRSTTLSPQHQSWPTISSVNSRGPSRVSTTAEIEEQVWYTLEVHSGQKRGNELLCRMNVVLQNSSGNSNMVSPLVSPAWQRKSKGIGERLSLWASGSIFLFCYLWMTTKGIKQRDLNSVSNCSVGEFSQNFALSLSCVPETFFHSFGSTKESKNVQMI